MRSLYLLIMLMALCFSSASAQTDELLKHYTGTAQVYFTNPAIDMQCARMEPIAPCYVKKIILNMTGGIGTFRLRLFGYEAGDQIPGLQNDKIPPIKVDKTVNGNQTITVTLPEPVYFDNSWFWIAVDSLSQGVILLSDNVEKTIPYDTYYYQAIHIKDPDPTKEWGIAPYAYFIGCTVNYPVESFCDVVKIVGIVFSLS